MLRASGALALLLLGCDQTGSSAHQKVVDLDSSFDASIVMDANTDADPCPESVEAFCEAGHCLWDWSQAATPCSLGRVLYSNAVCAGTRALWACGTDWCTVYEYDAVTGRLVAVVGSGNALDRCLASDLPRGQTPMVAFGSAPPGPQCTWTDDAGLLGDWFEEADGSCDNLLDAGVSDATGD